jgi:hypothetical protein
VHGHLNYPGEQQLREKAMRIDWMTVVELTQAIPPVYTEYIGKFLMREIKENSYESSYLCQGKYKR